MDRRRTRPGPRRRASGPSPVAARDPRHDGRAGHAPREAIAAIEVGRRIVAELIAGGIDPSASGRWASAIRRHRARSSPRCSIKPATRRHRPRHRPGRRRSCGSKAAVIETAIAAPRPDPSRRARSTCSRPSAASRSPRSRGRSWRRPRRRVPVVLDGFITGAAALVAAPQARTLPPRLIASHRSIEPGHRIVLDAARSRPHPRPRPAAGGGERSRPRHAGRPGRGADPRRDGDLRPGRSFRRQSRMGHETEELRARSGCSLGVRATDPAAAGSAWSQGGRS